MAGETTIGKLLVELLLKDDQFKKELKLSEQELDKAGKEFERISNRSMKALDFAFKIGIGALTAFAAATTVVGAEFERQMSAVAAVKGIEKVSEDFDNLTNKARELGASTAFTATQAAQGMEELARAGLDTSQVLEATETALKLAGAGQIELGRSAQIVAASMSQFSLNASEAERIADTFTVTTQNTQFAVEDMAQSMKFAGTVGSALGFSIEDTAAAVAQFRNLGLEGSMAGVNFRKAMTSLAGPTEGAKAALARLGLTLEQVNPATNDFRSVMIRLGEAQMTTADASAIFGNRAGLNVKKVADAMATSSESFDQLSTKLQEKAGATNDTYAKMSDNVLGRFNIMRSAIEETFLTMFDTFKAPLADFLDSITTVVGKVNAKLGGASGDIADTFTGIFGDLAMTIESNADEIATAFVTVIETAQDFAENMVPVIQNLGKILLALTPLIPLLDELATAMSVAFAARTVMALTPAIIAATNSVGPMLMAVKALGVAMKFNMAVNGVSAFGALSTAAKGFGVALAGSTGGITLLVGALVAASASLGIFLAKQKAARNEARLLAEANEALGASYDNLADAQDALNRDLDESAKKWDALNAAVDMQYETVELSAREALLAEIEFLEQQKKIGTISTKELAKLKEHRVELAKLDAEKAKAAEQEANRQKQLQAEIQSMREQDEAERKAAADADLARKKKVADAIVSFQAEQRKAAMDRLSDSDKLIAASMAEIEAIEKSRDEILRSASAQSERDEIARTSAAAIAEINDKLARDLQGLTDQQIEADKKKLDEQAALNEKANEILLADRMKSATEAEKIEFDKAKALESIAGASEEKRLAVAAIFDKKLQDLQKATPTAIGDAWAEFFETLPDGSGKAGKLVSKVFSKVGDTAKKVTAPIGKSFDKVWSKVKDGAQKVAGFLPDWAKDAVGSAAKFLGKFGGLVKTVLGEGAKGLIKFSGEVTAAIAKALSALANAVGGAVQALTGGLSLDPSEIVADVLDQQEKAAEKLAAAKAKALEVEAALQEKIESETDPEKRAKLQEELAKQQEESAAAIAEAEAEAGKGAAERASTLVDEQIDAALAFADTLAQALPVIIDQLMTRIPDLIDGIVNAIPKVVQSLVTGIPDIINGLIDALPPLMQALSSGILDLVTGLVGAVPELITRILTSLIPDLLNIAVELVQSLVPILTDAIPAILDSVANGIPTLIRSVFEAIPLIVMAVVNAVPQIVESVLLAVPNIVMAVVDSIPFIIRSVIGLIPQIIMALVVAIPQMLPAIISLIPILIIEIIGALPSIAVALVQSIFSELIPMLPTLAIELIAGMFESIGRIITMLVDAIVGAISGIFKKKDSDGDGTPDKKDKAPNDSTAAFSGINFVPATMRMTLHKGEAVVPADRNLQGPGRIQGPAPTGSPMSGGPAPGGGGSGTIEIPILVDGRLIDAVQVRAGQRGTANGMKKAIRRASGAKVGFDKGKFSAWSN